MKDKRVTEEDLKHFSKLEAFRSILEIRDLSDNEISRYRDETLRSIKLPKQIENMSYVSNRDAIHDMKSVGLELSVEDLEQFFNVYRLNDEYLIRSDYDASKTVELTKEWLFRILTEIGFNKPQRDKFWRDLKSFEFRACDINKFDVQKIDTDLSTNSSLIPTIEEVVENLSSNETVRMQLKQILYSIVIGHRFEDRAILMSGHKTRKKLFLQVIKALSINRMVSDSYKKLLKDSFDLEISKAIFIDGIATESEIDRLFDNLNHQIVLIDENSYVGDKIKLINVQLDRSPLDNVESKIETILTVDFVIKAATSLKSDSELLQTNRYIRMSSEDDDRLQEFMKYLTEITLIGNESIPSAMLYALYLDYCRYRKVKSEFQNQSQFSKAISESLIKYRYVLSEKTERIRAAIKSERLSSSLVEDLLETNLHFKDLYETNRASKVFNLRFDLVESSIENIESMIYPVTDFKVYRYSDKYIESSDKNDELSISAEMIALDIESLVSDTVKESTFRTIELMKYLSREIVMNGLKDVSERLSKVESIVSMDLTANLRIDLILDNYRKADSLEKIERAFRYNEIDQSLIEILSKRNDTRAKKLLKTFKSSVDRNKKQRVRENVISEICKNVRVV